MFMSRKAQCLSVAGLLTLGQAGFAVGATLDGGWTSFWEGRYEYKADTLQEKIDMVLRITHDGVCTLNATSNRGSERLACHGVPQPQDNTLQIRFDRVLAIRAAAGQVATQYEPNDVLFSLHSANMTQGLRTEWEALRPASASTAVGKFFLASVFYRGHRHVLLDPEQHMAMPGHNA